VEKRLIKLKIIFKISKLILNEEDSEDENNNNNNLIDKNKIHSNDHAAPMPDLSLPVQVVKKASDNLIRVGYETCATSQDEILRQEMPKALKQVEDACEYLQQAAYELKMEPKSMSGKRSLIAGERGILQGVSAILLTFDESEVRKIVRTCEQVKEYLSITELIEKMDDLVTYVKVIIKKIGPNSSLEYFIKHKHSHP
jgi:hypothetical protein